MGTSFPDGQGHARAVAIVWYTPGAHLSSMLPNFHKESQSIYLSIFLQKFIWKLFTKPQLAEIPT